MSIKEKSNKIQKLSWWRQKGRGHSEDKHHILSMCFEVLFYGPQHTGEHGKMPRQAGLGGLGGGSPI